MRAKEISQEVMHEWLEEKLKRMKSEELKRRITRAQLQCVGAFFAGFAVGPIYFNYVYPFLYHLVSP